VGFVVGLRHFHAPLITSAARSLFWRAGRSWSNSRSVCRPPASALLHDGDLLARSMSVENWVRSSANGRPAAPSSARLASHRACVAACIWRSATSVSYVHQDPREGFHQDWNTLIYNLGRDDVRGFLLAGVLPSPLAPPGHDLRPGLCVVRGLGAAAVARRGDPWPGLDDPQVPGRRLAALCRPARLLWFHVDASGQEAALHGRRTGPGMEP